MNPYVSLAKSAVENYVKKGERFSPPESLDEKLLNEKAGVFVTIEKNGKLKGCIGTSQPTQKNIAQEIINNAIAAATKDYRFGPISEEELPDLSFIVYVLGQLESIEEIKELNPKKYGVLVRSKKNPNKSGLLLPDLEGVDTIDKQFSIACRKAGITSQDEELLVYRFEVKKYQ